MFRIGFFLLAMSTLSFVVKANTAESRINKRVLIDLVGGASIQAVLLVKKQDYIGLDLGYRTLSIPHINVRKISVLDEILDSEKNKKINKGLYHSHTNRKPLSVAENIKRCAESVVQVRTPVGLGSGFIIHDSGYVVTNHHVIAGENKMTITLFKKGVQGLEKVVFENIRIVALNADADLALLKIGDLKKQQLSVLPITAQASLAQGSPVFSIGSPLGLDRTVSQGIISMANRQVSGRLYIQSTVQTNPGNSGGPLFNLKGEVVGVINMKIQAVGIEGLNFAIPAEILKYFLNNIDAYAFDVQNPNAGYRYFHIPLMNKKEQP